MNPQMLKMLMPILAGAGLKEVTTSIERIFKALGVNGKSAQQQPRGQATGAAPSMPSPQVGMAPNQINPDAIKMMAAMMQAKQGGMA